MSETFIPRERMSDILLEVADRHGVTVDELTGPRRLRHIVRARHEAMAETWRRTPLSKCEIGRRMGGRDHATVIHGIRAHLAREGAKAMDQ